MMSPQIIKHLIILGVFLLNSQGCQFMLQYSNLYQFYWLFYKKTLIIIIYRENEVTLYCFCAEMFATVVHEDNIIY